MATQINWNGEALGVFAAGADTTVVRKTTDGRFAVIDATEKRIIQIFENLLAARRYNFAIHGASLGE